MISKKLNSCISEMAKSNGYSYSGQGIAHEPGHQYQNASSDIYEVEHIMNHRRGKSGRLEYLVKWRGYSNADNTWEPIESFSDGNMVHSYHEALSRRDVNEKYVRAQPREMSTQVSGQQQPHVSARDGASLQKKSKLPKHRPQPVVLSSEDSDEDEQPKNRKPPKRRSRQAIVSSSDSDSGLDSTIDSKSGTPKRSKVRVPFELLEVEALLDVRKTKRSSDLLALVKWKYITYPKYVPIGVAHAKCPQMLIKYYESRVFWYNEGDLAKMQSF